ncbi:MAG TPA: sigma-70 family RNA polymerase sigma factor [Puia sp.]|nr:sigma-70 family RNA polymerase sigma factor [Puia sp.]
MWKRKANMDYNNIDTAILLRLLKVDDEAAFKELYSRKWKGTYTHCLRKIHHRQAAEELVQNIWAGLWNHRHTSTIDNLDSYLKAAVKYQVINYIKSTLLRSQKLTAASRQIKGDALSTEADTDVLVKELSAAIENAIDALPEKTGRVFRLSRIENHSVRDISREMNISEKAVEYHITKSLKLIRLRLKEYNLLLLLILIILER